VRSGSNLVEETTKSGKTHGVRTLFYKADGKATSIDHHDNLYGNEFRVRRVREQGEKSEMANDAARSRVSLTKYSLATVNLNNKIQSATPPRCSVHERRSGIH
jgi:hypothetical protein